MNAIAIAIKSEANRWAEWVGIHSLWHGLARIILSLLSYYMQHDLANVIDKMLCCTKIWSVWHYWVNPSEPRDLNQLK